MEQFRVTGDLNKTTLAEAVAARTSLTEAQAVEAVHAVLDTIVKAVVDGYSVSVTNFGSWHPAITPGRQGRNPATGEPVQIPESFRVKTIIAPKFKAAINGNAPADISKDPSV